LADFHEIWRDDAYWPLTVDRPLKFSIFENQDSGGCHLENHKNHDIRNGLTNLYKIWYSDAKWVSLTVPAVIKVEFQKSKMANTAILKTIKLPYLCNRSTHFDVIWHGDAYWSPEPDIK